MALVSDVLFVADIDHVRLFSASTGAFIAAYKVEGAEFLNDVLALPDGHVLVSDMAKNRIVRVSRDGQITTWAEGPQLGGANGLALAANHVWLAGYADGQLTQLSLDGSVVSRKKVEGELDGVVALGQSVLVSSWAKKAVLRVGPGDEVKVLLRGLESPADIGFDDKRKRLLVPMMMKNRLLVFAVD
jgi:hypothetical protein